MSAGVDYLTHPGRDLPTGVEAERFEVVVELLSFSRKERLRVRCQVPADDPVVPSLFDLWPGSEAHERETFDMFGIRFSDHPDLTRILMPEDWEGHPLRKDYAPGTSRCSSRRRPSEQAGAASWRREARPGVARRPVEGQDLGGCAGNAPASTPPSGSCGPSSAGSCACRRRVVDPDDFNYEAPDDETMILNLGPRTRPRTGC